MRIENPNLYEIDSFEIPKKGNSKYIAILKDADGNIKRVPFGDKRYEHYYDKLKYYSNLNHNDPKRRELFLKRHAKNSQFKYSSAWFSKEILW